MTSMIGATLDAAFSQLDVPYRWECRGRAALAVSPQTYTGNRFDCTGMMLWALAQGGWRPLDPVYVTCDQAYDNFRFGRWKGRRLAATEEMQPGDLVFWGPPDQPQNATHCGIAISSEYIISASGGYKSTTTDAEAARLGACVQIKHRDFHNYPIAAIIRLT